MTTPNPFTNLCDFINSTGQKSAAVIVVNEAPKKWHGLHEFFCRSMSCDYFWRQSNGRVTNKGMVFLH